MEPEPRCDYRHGLCRVAGAARPAFQFWYELKTNPWWRWIGFHSVAAQSVNFELIQLFFSCNVWRNVLLFWPYSSAFARNAKMKALRSVPVNFMCEHDFFLLWPMGVGFFQWFSPLWMFKIGSLFSQIVYFVHMAFSQTYREGFGRTLVGQGCRRLLRLKRFGRRTVLAGIRALDWILSGGGPHGSSGGNSHVRGNVSHRCLMSSAKTADGRTGVARDHERGKPMLHRLLILSSNMCYIETYWTRDSMKFSYHLVDEKFIESRDSMGKDHRISKFDDHCHRNLWHENTRLKPVKTLMWISSAICLPYTWVSAQSLRFIKVSHFAELWCITQLNLKPYFAMHL